jgi:hypothetical protein
MGLMTLAVPVVLAVTWLMAAHPAGAAEAAASPRVREPNRQPSVWTRRAVRIPRARSFRSTAR